MSESQVVVRPDHDHPTTLNGRLGAIVLSYCSEVGVYTRFHERPSTMEASALIVKVHSFPSLIPSRRNGQASPVIGG
jgi:hypothetical protein